MRERITENEYKAKHLKLKYSDLPLTAEEWREEERRESNFELLLYLMEQNDEIFKRQKEKQ